MVGSIGSDLFVAPLALLPCCGLVSRSVVGLSAVSMCGRVAQSHTAVASAARVLGVPESRIPPPPSRDGALAKEASGTASTTHTEIEASSALGSVEEAAGPEGRSAAAASYEWRDNYNLSPGMQAYVVFNDHHGHGTTTTPTTMTKPKTPGTTTSAGTPPRSSTASDPGAIPPSPPPSLSSLRVDLKTWGLVTRGGTPHAPLKANDLSLHFANRMFNARTDTLWERPTFSSLVGAGQTCVVALDGFFEWKAAASKAAAVKKQPYFVHRRPCLLLAGLWTRVPTGRTIDHESPGGGDGLSEPYLDTFTILTTDVSPALKWLHTRMPVVLDDAHAREWLMLRPGSSTHRRRDLVKRLVERTRDVDVQWHPVTPLMSSLKFRSIEAVRPLPPPKTLAAFFRPKGAAATNDAVAASPPARNDSSDGALAPAATSLPTLPALLPLPPTRPAPAAPTPPAKRRRVGTIDAFFVKRESPAKKNSHSPTTAPPRTP